MEDSNKPGEKSADTEAKTKQQPQSKSVSDAEKAAKAQAFVKAQKEDQKKSDKADYSDKDKEAEKAQKRPRTGFLWFILLCTLGLSGAAGYGVYYLWQQWQVERGNAQSVEGELAQTKTAIVDVRDDFKALQNELGRESASRAEELTATQNTIKLLEKTVSKQSRQMQALTQTNRDEWLLAETEYLLRLANQRILMSKEVGGPLAMLQSADKILREIDDVSLHPVRRAIARDIAALSRTDPVDVDGEYLKLAALTDSLDELELHDIPEFSNDAPQEPVEATMPEQPTWQESAARVGNAIKTTLGKVFVVRRHDEPVEAMLPPQQELYLRQNLRLMLEQAQLALLARKPDTYQQSLDKAQQWIARYFIADDAGTKAALQTLENARTINIDPPLPDISGSYHALKEYTESAYSRKLEASAAAQPQRTESQTAQPPQTNGGARETRAVDPESTPTQEEAPETAPEPQAEAAPKKKEAAPAKEPQPEKEAKLQQTSPADEAANVEQQQGTVQEKPTTKAEPRQAATESANPKVNQQKPPAGESAPASGDTPAASAKDEAVAAPQED